MFVFLTISKALADENRLRIIMALKKEELCVCTITSLLGLSPSTTSKHLSILKQARLIESIREGRYSYYRLANSSHSESEKIQKTLELVLDSLSNAKEVIEDNKKLEKILAEGEESKPVNKKSPARLYKHAPGIHM